MPRKLPPIRQVLFVHFSCCDSTAPPKFCADVPQPFARLHSDRSQGLLFYGSSRAMIFEMMAFVHCLYLVKPSAIRPGHTLTVDPVFTRFLSSKFAAEIS